jgi:hypothetical protein
VTYYIWRKTYDIEGIVNGYYTSNGSMVSAALVLIPLLKILSSPLLGTRGRHQWCL